MKQQVQPIRVNTNEERIAILMEFQKLTGNDDDQFWLSIIFILACFRTSAPYPILILQGEQGSAKSTLSKFIRLLIDPNLSPVSILPKNDQDMMIAMQGNRVLAYDNLSGMNDTVSDRLCRAATGIGLTVRELYTTSGQVTFNGSCPIILNGIDNIARRPDLGSRSLLLNLKAIPPDAFLGMSDVNRQFEELRPKLIGVIFDLLSEILLKLPETTVRPNVRMVDAVRWATATESMLGVEQGMFQRICEENYISATTISLEDDPVGNAIIEYMEERSQWEGEMKTLLGNLSTHAGKPLANSSAWPKMANKLSLHLNRMVTSLRLYGIDIVRVKEPGSNSRRLVTITNHNYVAVEEPSITT